ncbi:MAG: TetR/AcrR family transcriptional regulator [Verrucomicrobiota bacterium]
MRYDQDRKVRSRAIILDAGARVFRRHGYRGASVSKVMAEAGFTVGGFYAHFKDKDELYRKSFIHAVSESGHLLHEGIETLSRWDWVRAMAERYLSDEHLQMSDKGCPLPSLSSDVARDEANAKSAFDDCLQLRLEQALEHFPESERDQAREVVISVYCMGIGALSLARAYQSDDRRIEILQAARSGISTLLEGRE